MTHITSKQLMPFSSTIYENIESTAVGDINSFELIQAS